MAAHTRAVIAAFAVAAFAGATQLGALRVDSTVDNLMLDDDAQRQRNQHAKVEFSDDELILVGVDVGRPFDADAIRDLHALSVRLASVDGVEEVLDLSTIEDVRSEGDAIDASPLIDIDRIDEEIARISHRAKGHRIYDRNVVSSDADALLLVVHLEPGDNGVGRKNEVARDVRAVVDGWKGSGNLYLTGGPALEYELHTSMSQDLTILVPLALAIMSVFVHWAFGHAWAVGLVIAAIAWCELITLGCMAAAGIAISTVTSAVPIMTLAVASTYAIYFLGMLRNASDGDTPSVAVIALLARPAFLSAASTAVGFASLTFLGIEGIDQLGATLVVAILAAYSATMLLLPTLAHAFAIRLPHRDRARTRRWATVGVRLAARPNATLLGGAVMVAVAAVGVLRLEISSEPVTFLDPEGVVVRGNDFLRERFGGTTILRLVIDTHEQDAALGADVLAFLETAIERIESDPNVVRTQSLLDYFYLMDAAMQPDRPPSAVPDSRALAAQYLLLYESGGDRADLRHYLNYDRSALSVTVKARTQTTEATMAVAETMEDAAANTPAGVEVYVVGNATLMARALNTITRGMMLGLATASALIFLVMTLILGSLRLALLAMIPNITPVVCGIGLLGWLGEPLSVGTSIIGAMVLGLAVDDTAHVLGHVDAEHDLTKTYEAVGGPLLLTSGALGVGFSALTLSKLTLVATVGWTMLLTMGLALIADLIVLPSLLVIAGCATAETPVERPTRAAFRLHRPPSTGHDGQVPASRLDPELKWRPEQHGT